MILSSNSSFNSIVGPLNSGLASKLSSTLDGKSELNTFFINQFLGGKKRNRKTRITRKTTRIKRLTKIKTNKKRLINRKSRKRRH